MSSHESASPRPRTHNNSQALRIETSSGEEFGDLAIKVCPLCPGKRSNDDIGRRWEGCEMWREQMPQLADHPMTLHGVAYDLAHNKTRPGYLGFRAGHDVQNKVW